MIDKDKMTLFITGMLLLLIMTTGLSYSYFSASVKGNENAKDVVVEAGTLSLVYTDGPEIKAQNIKPGWSTTKEVSVKNTGTLDTNYNIIWQSLTNEITNNEMVISATCQRLNSSGTVEGTCNTISESAISSSRISTNVSIESGITHKYTFTVLFKETNTNQNTNQGKKFNGVLGIEEYKAPNFTTDSWEAIIANVKAGYGSEYKVGDTKEVDLGTTYGIHTLRIANTSTPSECGTSGFSQTACGFVLEFADVITTNKMNDTNTNVGGWPASIMRTFVNNDIYDSLPDDLRSGIINTNVISGHGLDDTNNFTSTDKLYLLSPTEIWQGTSAYIDKDSAKDLTRQLDYYKNEGVTISNYSKAIKMYNSSVSSWWLRSAYSNSISYFYSVTDDGDWNYYIADSTSGVSVAFRLG